MRAKKSLGQNFLKSNAIVSDIIGAAELGPADNVLEIGPGKGVLTEELLKNAGRVVAVEKDDRLIPFLREKFAGEIKTGKLELVHGDILDLESRKLKVESSKYKLVANIPYYITGHLLRKFLTADNQPSRMVLLVQKEVANRICPTPSVGQKGGKESILSISVRAYGTPRKIKNVPAKYFSPKPKVDSAILVIENISRDFFVKSSAFDRTDEKKFFELVRAGFASKRKKLLPKLRKLGLNQKVFERCGINPNARAENLSPNQWKCLLLEA